MSRWRLLLASFVSLACWASAAEPKVTRTAPAKVGSRTAVVEFSTGAGAKPTDLKVVSTESVPLSDFVQWLLLAGKVTLETAGVSKVGDNRYRLTVAFPVTNDGEPLPAGVTPPVPRIRPVPVFPYALRQQGIAGGVVLRLTIDEKARLKKVELVSASHPEFGPVAIQAVEKWVFGKPAMQDGKPVAVSMLQLLVFEYAEKPAPVQWQISPEPGLPEYIVTTGLAVRPAESGKAAKK